MPQTKGGNQASQFPIGKAVGQQYVPVVAPGAPIAASIAVPGAAPLVLNGVVILINVRTMSGQDICNAINNAIPGVTASINGAGAIVITGINSIDGDANLRAILGI